MGRKRERRGLAQLNPMDEINLTPMIDLVFLLLIVFMITTPLLENALDVSPPVMNANDLPDKNTKTVEVDRHGTIKFDGQSFTEETLAEHMKTLYGENPSLNVNVRADGDRAYKDVVRILGSISKAGFRSVNLITLEEQ